MMFRKTVALVAMIAGSLVWAPARADAVPPTLRGTNVISAARSSWMPVRLPRAVTISTAPFEDTALKIASGGPLAAIVLRQDVRRGIEVVATRTDLCRSCKDRPFDLFQVFDPGARERRPNITLPAGRYQLYVVADGARTEARLELPGLSGRKRLTPSRRADVKIRPSRSSEASSPYVQDHQVDHGLSVRGISLLTLELDTDRFAGTNMSACIEPSDGEVPAAMDDGTCEGGRTAGSGTVARHNLEGGRKVVVSMGQLGPGSWEHSLRFRTASVVRSTSARSLVLTYSTDDRSDDWLYTLGFSF